MASEEKTVMVFDICSSTSIIEDLNKTGSIERYLQLLEQITSTLVTESFTYHYSIYKFLGDGFILLFDEHISVDEVLFFSIRLTNQCNAFLDDFIERYLENKELPRKGITIGVDRGQVIRLRIGTNKDYDYIGRPFNVACRLQSSLDKPEHVNYLLMTVKVHSEIRTPELKVACHETSRTLRNISDKKLRYYDFYPPFFKEGDAEVLREPIKKSYETKASRDEQLQTKIIEIFENATSTSPVLGFSWFTDKIGK